MDEPFASAEPTPTATPPADRPSSTRWIIAAGAPVAVAILAATVWLLGGRSATDTTGSLASPAATTVPVASAPPAPSSTDAAVAPTSTVTAAAPSAPSSASSSRPTPPVAVGGPGPRRLRIGTIGVDAAVVPVGVEANGEMEVPPAADVGWYRFGPQPSQAGSAVLAAHVDFDGQRGAFFRLRDLSPGAEVEVTGAEGAVSRFRVTAVERFPKDELPDRIFERTGPARLALITCGGEFDAAARSYRDNVVAFAEPIG